jgi:hypothetical protein
MFNKPISAFPEGGLLTSVKNPLSAFNKNGQSKKRD